MKRALIAVAALIALASCASTATAREAGLTFGGPSMFSALRLIPR
jgi:hypothetical protein